MTFPSPQNTIPLKTLLGVNMGSIYQAKPGLWCAAFYWKKQRFLIYKNQSGESHETEKMAARTLALIEDQIRLKQFDPASWRIDRPFLFENAVRIWLERKQVSLETLEARERNVDHHMSPYFKGRDIREIRTIHLEEFLNELKKKGLSDKSTYNIMGDLRACLRFHRDSIPKLPVFPKIEYQEPAIRWLTDDQQDRVFEFIPDQDRFIFIFQRFTGCRPNEARGLLRENVHKDKGIIVIATVLDSKGVLRERTKTKRIRVLPIVPEIEECLKAREVSRFVFTKNGHPYIKRTHEKIWAEAMRKAHEKYGVPVVSMYPGTKHSLGMNRLNEGISKDLLQALFGHTDKKSTERYAKYLAESLAPAMRGKVTYLTNVSQDKDKASK